MRPVNVAEEDLKSVMQSLGMREGFDVGLEMSGAEAALNQMLDTIIIGGKIAILGIPARPFPVDLTKIVFHMLTIKGIYGREMFETWHKMIAMLRERAERPRRHHPPLPRGRLSQGVRDHGEGRVGQGRAGLVGRLIDAGESRFARPSGRD